MKKLKYVLDDLKMNDSIEITYWDDMRYDVMIHRCKVIDVMKVYKPEILDQLVKFVVPQNGWYDIYLTNEKEEE